MTQENPFDEDRVQNLEDMESQGEFPYDSVDESPDTVQSFIDQYESLDEIDDDTEWTLSGRIRRENEFGDFVFYDIDDRTGTVQVMCSVDERSEFETEQFEVTGSLNIGDRVMFTGTAGRSNTGELTLFAESLNVVSKSLTDVSREWNTLGNQQRIENRTGALSGEDDRLFNTVQDRMLVQQKLRSYLTELDYLEVETPILHNYAGGAEATPFETYCEALERDVYLRIAPELYLKRLMVAGYGRVFEIARCFRNESIDTTHNPEFSMLELYEEYADYRDMMNLTESMFATVAEEITGSQEIRYDGQSIDLSPPWERRTFDECVSEALDSELQDISRDGIVDYLTSNYDFEPHELTDLSYDELLIEVFEYTVEPTLEQPVFIYNYPTVSTPLCQTIEGDSTRVQRFEAFVAGMEVANSYTELTDPREQRERLIQQADGDESVINNEFVDALAYGMPPTAGLGVGVERLAMLLTDSQSIKDVLPYPMASTRR